MPTPSRDEALATLEEGHRLLEALFARLDDEQFVAPKTIGGGDWSAKDLLGHIAFWEELALEALADLRAGATPRIEAIFARAAEGIDEINAGNQQRTAMRSLEEAKARAAAAREALVTAIGSMSDDEWGSKVPYETERRETTAALLASILGAPKRPFGHAFAHIPDLEAYVSQLT
ncbi:MAG: DinB family protein [Actinomycetota bacterium]